MKLNKEIVITVKGATWSGNTMECAVEAYVMGAGNLRNALAISEVISASDFQAMAYAKCIGAAYADEAVKTRVVGAREEFYAWLASKPRSKKEVDLYIAKQGGAFEKQFTVWIGIADLVRDVRNQFEQKETS